MWHVLGWKLFVFLLWKKKQFNSKRFGEYFGFDIWSLAYNCWGQLDWIIQLNFGFWKGLIAVIYKFTGKTKIEFPYTCFSIK